MSSRLKGHEAVRDWLVSALLNLLLPLLPLLVEHFAKAEVSSLSWVLAASMYSITTGVVSRYAVVLIISVMLSLFYTAMFGVLLVKETAGSFNAPVVIGVLFITNVILKFWYHVIERRPFTDFALRGD